MPLTIDSWYTLPAAKNISRKILPQRIREFSRASGLATGCAPTDQKLKRLLFAIELQLIRLVIKDDSKSRQKTIDIINELNKVVDKIIADAGANANAVKAADQKSIVADRSIYISLRDACLNSGDLRTALGYGLIPDDDSFKNVKFAIAEIDQTTNEGVPATAASTTVAVDEKDQAIISKIIAFAVAERLEVPAREIIAPIIAQVIAILKRREHEIDEKDFAIAIDIVVFNKIKPDPAMIAEMVVAIKQVAFNVGNYLPEQYQQFHATFALFDSKAIPFAIPPSYYVVRVASDCVAFCGDQGITFLFQPADGVAHKFLVPLNNNPDYPLGIFGIFNRGVVLCYPSKMVFIDLETQQADTFSPIFDNGGADAKDAKRELLQCRSHVVSPNGKKLIFIKGNHAYCLNLQSKPYQLQPLINVAEKDSRLLFHTDERFSVISFFDRNFSLKIYKLNNTVDLIKTIKLAQPTDVPADIGAIGDQDWNVNLSPNRKILAVVCNLKYGNQGLIFYDLAILAESSQTLKINRDIIKASDFLYSRVSGLERLQQYLQWQGNNCLVDQERHYYSYFTPRRLMNRLEVSRQEFLRSGKTKYIVRQNDELDAFILCSNVTLHDTYISRQELAERQTWLLIALVYLLSKSNLPIGPLSVIAEYYCEPKLLRGGTAFALCNSMFPALGIKKTASASSTALPTVSSSAHQDSKGSVTRPIASSSSSNSSVPRGLKV